MGTNIALWYLAAFVIIASSYIGIKLAGPYIETSEKRAHTQKRNMRLCIAIIFPFLVTGASVCCAFILETYAGFETPASPLVCFLFGACFVVFLIAAARGIRLRFQ